jgi:serine/threonine protein kinase
MWSDDANEPGNAKFAGLAVDVLGVGKACLTELLSCNGETSVYLLDHPGIIVKIFDLDCGNPEEVSYAPYAAFNLELENFEDMGKIEELNRRVPAFYGSVLDYEKKFAFLAMEHLHGENLSQWCAGAAGLGYPEEWINQFRAALYETLTVVRMFHKHSIILIDFKPDNVFRLPDGRIKFVDLGAFFTPRHSRKTEEYLYSATPDYSELVIDTSNVQTGIPLNEASDIFAAGVALFEMTTGNSRLALADQTSDLILGSPGLFRFRDTQIRDVWRAYPHLEGLLPLVETQLKERRILFSEVWHLLKGYVAREAPGWEDLSEPEQSEMILETGRSLIADQLPPALAWLADAIAQATTLRRLRLKTVGDLMRLIASPIDEEISEEIRGKNTMVRYAEEMGHSAEFVKGLNKWEIRRNQQTGNWAILIPAAYVELGENASFTFLKRVFSDQEGHAFFEIVSDLEADFFEGGRLTVAHLRDDHFAWLAG